MVRLPLRFLAAVIVVACAPAEPQPRAPATSASSRLRAMAAGHPAVGCFDLQYGPWSKEISEHGLWPPTYLELGTSVVIKPPVLGLQVRGMAPFAGAFGAWSPLRGDSLTSARRSRGSPGSRSRLPSMAIPSAERLVYTRMS